MVPVPELADAADERVIERRFHLSEIRRLTWQVRQTLAGHLTPMARKNASEASVSVYLRMPRTARNTLDEMARHLGMKPSIVTNAVFRFVTQPDWFQGWDDHVKHLRAIVAREGDGMKLCLHDFSIEEWQERRRTYDWLDKMGLIEDFGWRRSMNHSTRIICSFNVSDTGRVIALMFKESGIADPIEQDELDEAAADTGADSMAS